MRTFTEHLHKVINVTTEATTMTDATSKAIGITGLLENILAVSATSQPPEGAACVKGMASCDSALGCDAA